MAIPQNENESARPMYHAVFERQGNKSTRLIRIPWDTLEDELNNYLGYSYYSNGKIIRYLPHRDFNFPGKICVRAEVVGEGFRGAETFPQVPMGSGNLWENALVKLYYEVPRYDLGDYGGDPDDVLRGDEYQNEIQRYAIKEVRPAKEFYTAQQGTFVWAKAPVPPAGTPATAPAYLDSFVADPAKQVQFPLPAVLTYSDIVVTLLDWPYDAIPFVDINRCLGKVNTYDMELPARPPPSMYGRETLYLETYTITDVFFPSTQKGRGCNLTYYFRYRENEWNTYPDSTNTFRRYFRKAVGGTFAKNFVTTDFGVLTRPI